VTFRLELNGFGPDPYGGTRAGFSATTEINRNDWNVSFNGAIPGSGSAVVLSDKVTVNLEIEAVLSQDK
jgi:polyisoprenoid-binding protein YceI